jgi:2-iminobutanoate/2-iminopropanoate deaminase
MSWDTRCSIEVDGIGHGGPLPLAARIGPFLATSKIHGRDPATGQYPTDTNAQVRRLFENMAAVLAAGGAAPRHVLKADFAVRSLDLRDAINASWIEMFPDPASRPARQVSTAPDLPTGRLIECVLWAVIT